MAIGGVANENGAVGVQHGYAVSLWLSENHVKISLYHGLEKCSNVGVAGGVMAGCRHRRRKRRKLAINNTAGGNVINIIS
jgi:hypothetical protein